MWVVNQLDHLDCHDISGLPVLRLDDLAVRPLAEELLSLVLLLDELPGCFEFEG